MNREKFVERVKKLLDDAINNMNQNNLDIVTSIEFNLVEKYAITITFVSEEKK